MVKVFGIPGCDACAEFIALLITKGVKYEYYDTETVNGLTLLANYGLADQELSPIVVSEEGELLDFDNFVAEVVKM
jgi:glutaredoxin